MRRALPPALRPVLAALAFLAHAEGTALAAGASARGLDDLCRPAIAAAEIDAQLPRGLLLAIARVESGRRDPASGTVIPFPWTINAEGVPMVFDTREAAAATVESLRARAVRSIDVGCMQVNLHHHPQAFASIAEAFDPDINTRYAAAFLIRLRDAAGGDWNVAIGRYHSSTPGLSEGYRARVLAAWGGTGRASPVESPQERMVAAWASGRPARPTPPAIARPRDPRDAVEQIAIAWGRTRPPDAHEPPPAPTWTMGPVARNAPRPGWTGASSPGLRLAAR